MFTLRSSRIWLLAFCLLLFGAFDTATAKKPTPVELPPAPVQYQVTWLPGLNGYTWTYVYNINHEGTIVGRVVDGETCEARAVRWELAGDGLVPPPATDLNGFFDFNQDEDLKGGYLCGAACISNSGLIAGCFKDSDGIGHVSVCHPESGGFWYLKHNGSFSIRDISDDGTVVGYVVDDADVKRGFIWNCFDDKLLLCENYLLSGISVIADSDVVIGIIGDGMSGEMFRGTVNWNDPNNPITAIEPLGASAQLFAPYNGRPAINNSGQIAATVSVSRSYEPRQLSPEEGASWELLLDETDYIWCAVSDINDMGQICGVWNPRKPRNFFPGFVYFWDHIDEVYKFWPLDDLIVKDAPDSWGAEMVILTAVADYGVFTCEGLSPVVGWTDGGSFVLVPIQE